MFCVASTPVYTYHPGAIFDVNFHPQYDYRGCPHYRAPAFAVDFDSAVERAARDYIHAQARVETLRRQRYEQACIHYRQQEQRLANIELARWLQQDTRTSHDHFSPDFLLVDERSARREADLKARHQQLQRLQEDRRRKVAMLRRLEQVKEGERRALERKASNVAAQQEKLMNPKASLPQSTYTDPDNIRADLLRRLASEEDSGVQDVIDSLLARLFNAQPSEPQPVDPKEDKGKARESPAIPFPWSNTELPVKKSVHFTDIAPPTLSGDVQTTETQDTDHPRATSVLFPESETNEPFGGRQIQRQVALDKIDSVYSSLKELQHSFVFPAELDFRPRPSPSPVPSALESDVEDSPLPFTHRNKPVLAYEHALNGLLAQLDDVASHGDEEIRNKRREVVVEVEKALGEVEQLVAAASPQLDVAELSPDAVAVSEVETVDLQGATYPSALTSVPAPSQQAASVVSEVVSNDDTSSSEPSLRGAASLDSRDVAIVPALAEEPEQDNSSSTVGIISCSTNAAIKTVPTKHVDALSGDELQAEIHQEPESSPCSVDIFAGPAAADEDQQGLQELDMDADPAAALVSDETEDTHLAGAASSSPPHSAKEDHPTSSPTIAPYLLRSSALENEGSFARAKATTTGDDVEWEDADLSVPSDAEDGWSEVE